VIADGDFVALHVDYNFFGEKVGFDVFRFENDKIVEHWDNLQERPANTVCGHTMTDGRTEIGDLEKTDSNMHLIQSFVQDILRDGKSDRILEYISKESYTQRNPNLAMV